MPLSKSYPTAHIDLSALTHNLTRVKQLAPNSKIMSVVKANGYGHGMVEIAKALDASDALCVARLSEGLCLRAAGIERPIVILEGVHSADDMQIAAEEDLSLVFNTEIQVELAISTELIKPLTFCWLMLETGMHRLGISADKIEQILTALKVTDNISGSMGLMSHFANANAIGDKRNYQQLNQIIHCAASHDLLISMANSAAIISYPESHVDWVRPGIMLYGSSPFETKTAAELDLKAVMKLTSTLIDLHDLQAGDEVGYGGDWVAKQKARIGIVSIGYGDGYSRQLSNSSVVVNGELVAILGRISMDMIVIDLTDVSTAKVGDDVVLWGSNELTVDCLAKDANTISYELLCQVNDRVKREFYYG